MSLQKLLNIKPAPTNNISDSATSMIINRPRNRDRVMRKADPKPSSLSALTKSGLEAWIAGAKPDNIHAAVTIQSIERSAGKLTPILLNPGTDWSASLGIAALSASAPQYAISKPNAPPIVASVALSINC